VAVGVAAAGVAVAVGVGASAGVAVAAGVADGGDASMVFIYLFFLAKEAHRRKCQCVKAPEILPTSHRSGAGA